MRPPLIVGGEEQAGRGHVLLVLGSSPREEGAESKYAPSRRLYAFALVSSGDPGRPGRECALHCGTIGLAVDLGEPTVTTLPACSNHVGTIKSPDAHLPAPQRCP